MQLYAAKGWVEHPWSCTKGHDLHLRQSWKEEWQQRLVHMLDARSPPLKAWGSSWYPTLCLIRGRYCSCSPARLVRNSSACLTEPWPLAALVGDRWMPLCQIYNQAVLAPMHWHSGPPVAKAGSRTWGLLVAEPLDLRLVQTAALLLFLLPHWPAKQPSMGPFRSLCFVPLPAASAAPEAAAS